MRPGASQSVLERQTAAGGARRPFAVQDIDRSEAGFMTGKVMDKKAYPVKIVGRA